MGSRRDMIPLVVRDVVRETPSIVSVRLERVDGEPLPPWQPGAHVDVQLVTRHERQYSLCGDPADVHAYRIAVLDEPRSRGGSYYVHRFLRVGSLVHVRPPRNLFPLGQAQRYLLLAAGIGITPILAMARQLAAQGAHWRMIYAVRHPGDVAFASELEAFDDRVRVHVSAADGRLDLGGLLAGLVPGTAVYACGPATFIESLSALAAPLPEGCHVHVERFEPKPRVLRENEPFTVELARSGRVIQIPADRSMLRALQGQGVDVAGSCLRGVCGSCALQVLGGVPEHRDSLNPDDESTTIYPCVSRSLTPTLIVDA